MLTILLRTVLVYIILIATMRLMGKRQLGELEISELVTTLLISEIASLPIVDQNIPLAYAVIPLFTILTLEVILSAILLKCPGLKSVTSSRPSILIRHGVMDQGELQRNRISIDELISEIRQAGFCSPEDVDYAIVERNGKISILARRSAQPPSAKDLGLAPKESGLVHVLITDGKPNRYGMQLLGLDEAQIAKLLQQKGWAQDEVFFLGSDDAKNLYWIKKEEKP